jgi:hypothetical protein
VWIAAPPCRQPSPFLTTEATMTKRIVRAKRKIVESKVPFAVPSGEEVKGRLGEVLFKVGTLRGRPGPAGIQETHSSC